MTAGAGGMAERLAGIHATITRACRAAGRSVDEVRLVAVSKRVGPEAVLEAVHAGVRDFGESYLQQALPKIEAVGRLLGGGEGRQAPAVLRWHFVGRLQSNKASRVARTFHLIHSLDSMTAARAISRTMEEVGQESGVLLQVKLGGGSTRGGVVPEGCAAFAHALSELPGVSLAGVMGVADPEWPARPQFARLRAVLEELRAFGLPNAPLVEMSAGMSGDFVEAIGEGATIVRLGAAVFDRSSVAGS